MEKNTADRLKLKATVLNGATIFEIENIEEVNESINASIKEKVINTVSREENTISIMPSNYFIELDRQIVTGNSVLI